MGRPRIYANDAERQRAFRARRRRLREQRQAEGNRPIIPEEEMALTEKPERLPTADEKLAEILRAHRPLSFEDTIGPPPKRGDAEDLEDFLAFLEEQRRQPEKYPGDEG